MGPIDFGCQGPIDGLWPTINLTGHFASFICQQSYQCILEMPQGHVRGLFYLPALVKGPPGITHNRAICIFFIPPGQTELPEYF